MSFSTSLRMRLSVLFSKVINLLSVSLVNTQVSELYVTSGSLLVSHDFTFVFLDIA